MESIKAKNALVIGGGSGMGAASALLLAQNGARVAISGRREENLREVSSRSNSGSPLHIKPADIADRES
ncbi:MAG: SDR family NAD(P)-dependent oxidoreductase, partial [Opitutae bacterium]